MKISSVKSNSKQALKDNWTAAIAVTGIKLMLMLIALMLPSYVALLSPFASITLVTVLLFLFVYNPFSIGKCGWYLSLASGQKPPVSDIFSYFKGRSWSRSVEYGLRYYAKMLGWLLVTALPMIILAIYSETTGELEEFLPIVIVITNIAMIVVVIWTMLRFFLVPYILATNEDITVRESFRMSSRCMRRHKNEVVGLYFSFLPWAVFCILVIPYIYEKPYFDASRATLAKAILESYPKVVSDEPEQYNGGIPEEVTA